MDASVQLEELVLLRNQILQSQQWLQKLLEALDKKIAVLREKEVQLKSEREKELAVIAMSAEVVQLDVRGSIFHVPREDLLRSEDSFFTAMLASEHWQPGVDKSYFIDCNSEGFEQVIGSMRGEALALTSREGFSVLAALRCLQLPAHGTFSATEVEAYTGEYANGLRSGSGTYRYPTGSVYEGEWKDDKKEGRGTSSVADGNVYVGEYKNGVREGHGTYYYEDGHVYIGEWKEDKREGHGTLTYADGAVYIGQFKKSVREGQGTYTAASGNVYIGEWKNDKAEGHGKYSFANGNVCVGQYKSSKRHGRVMRTFPDGRVSDCIYVEGKLLLQTFT